MYKRKYYICSVKNCQYWQKFNAEFVYTNKNHYLCSVKKCQYWQKFNVGNGNKKKQVSSAADRKP